MLTSETKRHIDAARQVLVGVVPNPASQIDQITNTLIYKFMDDMDQSAIKAGGEPSFFTDELERYAWTRLMDPRIGNQERMNLYQDALQKFSEAKQLPELFRGIFKGAFLPYRSPEVLGLFLQEISYFDYSHSEELGNAYEYLLSIMSSQGDAGQFRTPRHIIDFIVAVVNPTKDDKVLDPACGTAGFLISAYKHIIEQHDGKSTDGSKNDEKPLTPDQRRALLSNFEGYDIDPGMVRIAQVNMYLHQFKNPKIFSYNALADEERWNDKFDVILANPPFMSPKGGVSTHNKFSIESSRSEVLFVDYIMNHLRPRGRAGVIVPEGIIFQSGKGHTQLRKNLIADGLWAVVSLPSGVFNPYAGVKTSVLLFDNELAKKNTEIVFVKVANDGFDLGANKRPINKNDLPIALEILKAWKEGIKTDNPLVVYVEKPKISEPNDFNLSGDRYRAVTDYSNAKWPMVELGEVCSFEYGKPLKEENRKGGLYPVFGSNGIVGYHNEYLAEGPFVIVGRKGTAGAVVYSEQSGFPIDTAFYIKLLNKEKIDTKFLYHILGALGLDQINTQAGVPGLNRNDAYKIQIPLPPLEIQQQIVEELDGYQKIISGARQIIENWKPKIEVDLQWDKAKLGEVCEFTQGVQIPKDQQINEPRIGFKRYLYIQDFKGESKSIYVEDNYPNKELSNYDLVMANTGTPGRAFLAVPGILSNNLFKISFDNSTLDRKYLFYYLEGGPFQEILQSQMKGGIQKHLGHVTISQQEISLPTLEIQQKVVEEIESERALVESAKKLIGIYEGKMKETLAKLWKE